MSQERQRFCTSCGSPLRGAFCAQCGAPGRFPATDDTASPPPAERPRPAAASEAEIPTASAFPAPAGVAARIAKSLGTSALLTIAVLGPGIALMQEERVLGGMWLLVGSFGMMAWTYRRHVPPERGQCRTVPQ